MPIFGPNDVPEEEAERQAAVARSGAANRRGDRELQRITDSVATAYRTMFSAISIMKEDREIILARCEVPFWDTARSDSFCAVAIHRPGEALVVGNAADDPRFKNLTVVRSAPFVRFYAGIPLVSRDGYALGALCVADPAPRDERVDLATLISSARAVERVISRW